LKEGIQTSFKHEELQKYGCYFFSLLRWCELIRLSSLSDELKKLYRGFEDDEIINIFLACKNRGYIGSNAFIINASEVMNYVLGEKLFSGVSITSQRPDRQQLFLTRFRKSPNLLHFVLSSPTEFVLWDSWMPRVDLERHPVDSYRVLLQ